MVREHPTLLLSMDTVKAEVARAALDAGAAIVNDVSALRLDPRHGGEWWLAAGAGVILMHSRGIHSRDSLLPHAEYRGDVVGGVVRRAAGGSGTGRGAPASGRSAIVVDPGFGFSKTVEQNMVLLDQLPRCRRWGGRYW